MKIGYYLKGSIFGILSIFFILGCLTFFVQKFSIAAVISNIPLWIGFLTCLLMGWILDKSRKHFHIFWGPIVFIPSAFTFIVCSLLAQMRDKRMDHPASPAEYILAFLYLVFFGGTISLLFAFIFRFFAKPGK